MEDKDYVLLQEEHLDCLITLAFKKMAIEEANEIIKEFDRRESEEEKKSCDRAYAQFLDKLQKTEKEEKRRNNIARMKMMAARVLQAVACILLIVAIAAPIAIAKVEPLRLLVLRLLIEQDEEQGAARVYMATDEELTFNVPEGWLGEYYMTYIPEGIEVQYISTFSGYVEYWDSEGIKLSFDEYGVGASAYLDNENAETWYTTVRGNDAYVISKNDRYTIVWAIEDRYFNVMVWRSTYDEALRIAEGVRKIIVEKN